MAALHWVPGAYEYTGSTSELATEREAREERREVRKRHAERRLAWMRNWAPDGPRYASVLEFVYGVGRTIDTVYVGEQFGHEAERNAMHAALLRDNPRVPLRVIDAMTASAYGSAIIIAAETAYNEGRWVAVVPIAKRGRNAQGKAVQRAHRTKGEDNE